MQTFETVTITYNAEDPKDNLEIIKLLKEFNVPFNPDSSIYNYIINDGDIEFLKYFTDSRIVCFYRVVISRFYIEKQYKILLFEHYSHFSNPIWNFSPLKFSPPR